jgi:hypothetical protein
MRLRTTLLALGAAALYTAPAYADTIPSDRAFALEANTTREYAMPIQGLGQDWNVLTPCFGFSITGPGVDLAGANLETYGLAIPEDASRPDGGIPGAQRQPDGSFTIPESAAVLTSEVLRLGANCRRVGWDFYGADGEPVLDPYGNPKTAAVSRTASKRKRDRARKRMSLKIKGRAASQGAVSVGLAGITVRDGKVAMVVRVATGALAGATELSMHARVLKQSDAAPR